jgi:hypothetical protein
MNSEALSVPEKFADTDVKRKGNQTKDVSRESDAKRENIARE